MREPEHLEAIRDAKGRRLTHLELRAAREGNDTPPDVLTEIEDLRREIAPVAAITNSPVSEETLGALNAYGRLESTMRAVMTLTADVSEMKKEGKEDRIERVKRQHRTDLVQVFLFVSFFFLAIIVLVR